MDGAPSGFGFRDERQPEVSFGTFLCIKEKYGNVLYAWAMASLRACCSSSVNL